ncbi:hyaluronidase-2 isoform X2 [Bufo bufo]|nr:hyaluronidase-2 isoform X2 [Bufo bufo]XP_040264488.1 hyaluronidase-2 isoform X2 [Bufo bufo]XP_040264489.1 hyaluronidase-2 isoform X2 [Bufo bufo]XP_040264490.1 hyaluronidase-2 isoform X2 [Bufo bufo]
MPASFMSILWCLLLTFHLDLSSPAVEKPTFRPIYSRRPFVVGWNAPTQECPPRHNVPFDLRLFDFSASPNEGFVDQKLTMFYKERLGYYPYYDEHNTSYYGGVPQNASLSAHLSWMQEGLKKYINKMVDEEGLAVIDWEEWRPIWLRNWIPKHIYRDMSCKLVADRHPTWPKDNIQKQAQYEFESAARSFMEQTLLHARSFRPRQLWGFYLFPDCYNHDYQTDKERYTGKCPDVEISRNDQLSWLWEASTALFPSIYLNQTLESSAQGRKFVQFRVKEAMRIANKHHKDYALPVYVYSQPTYMKKMDTLSQIDLVHTIGESAAQGAAGVIFWGDAEYAKNTESCLKVKSYLEDIFGEYIVNVTTAADLCSRFLCSWNGRCLRQHNMTDGFLHLSSESFRIVRAAKGVNTAAPMWAEGQLSEDDKRYLSSHFRCQCYVDWYGDSCGTQRSTGNRAGITGRPRGHWLLGSLLALLLLLL